MRKQVIESAAFEVASQVRAVEDAIEEALAAGILSGYDDGSFRAERLTSRGEAAAMIYKLLAALGI